MPQAGFSTVWAALVARRARQQKTWGIVLCEAQAAQSDSLLMFLTSLANLLLK
jgi:hypothetical protein